MASEDNRAPVPNYVTTGIVLDVYDGDTITVLRDMGHNIHFQTHFRLIGIDTPELRGPEKAWGKLSRQHLIDLISTTAKWRVYSTPWGESRFPELVMRSLEPDKYGGRWLGEIWCAGGTTSLNLQMIEGGYAREYSGGTKTPYPLETLAEQPTNV